MSTLTYKLVDAVGDAAKGHKLKIGLRIRMCGETTPYTKLLDNDEGPAEITFKVLNKSNSKILSRLYSNGTRNCKRWFVKR